METAFFVPKALTVAAPPDERSAASTSVQAAV
jgi:hypothetical protein